MKYSNIFDSHTHSIHSFDGNHSCNALCDGAIEHGAIGIAITDHCDIDMKDFEPEKFAKVQFADVTKTQTDIRTNSKFCTVSSLDRVSSTSLCPKKYCPTINMILFSARFTI